MIESCGHERIGFAAQLLGSDANALIQAFGASAVVLVEVREINLFVTELHFRRHGMCGAGQGAAQHGGQHDRKGLHDHPRLNWREMRFIQENGIA
jgi:hypothetical protein